MLLRSKVVTSKVLALASVLVVGAFVGSACSTVNPSAATVNGDSIDRASFTDSLQQFADNPAFIARVSQSGQASVTGNGSDTVSADFARQALQREIVVMVAKQQNEARGAKVTPEIEAAARDDVEAQLGLDAFKGFPASFQQRLVDQNAADLHAPRQRRRLGARRRSTPEGLRRRPLAVRRGVRQPHPREHAGGSRRRREAPRQR